MDELVFDWQNPLEYSSAKKDKKQKKKQSESLISQGRVAQIEHHGYIGLSLTLADRSTDTCVLGY